jgi:hypothetical protein
MVVMVVDGEGAALRGQAPRVALARLSRAHGRRAGQDLTVRASRALVVGALAAAANLAANDASAQPAPIAVSARTGQALPAPSGPPEPSSSPPAPEPIDVTVEGEKAPPGSVSLGRRNVREMPGVLDDAYRAIEVQTGVTPTASGIPYYFIRGAPPGNIGYFFDGIQVPLLFHVGGGPSVIPAAMIRRVEFHPGPYPASFGRFAGAAVDAESTPIPYQWRGEGSLRVTDLGGIVEGPLREDLSVLAGGRYSIGAPLISALAQSVDFSYADYQARVSWQPRPEERLSVFAFGAFDVLASDECVKQTKAGKCSERTRDVLLDTDFHRLDLRYERETAAFGKVRASVTLGLDQSRQVGVERARDGKLDARVSVSRPVASGGALLRGGLGISLDRYDVAPFAEPYSKRHPADEHATNAEIKALLDRDQLEDAFQTLFPSRLDLALGGWVDALVVLDERSTLNPGLRVDHYSSRGNTALAIDPKLVGRFGVSDHVRLVPAVAVASQLPGFAPLPALQIGGIPGGLQRSLQSSFGAEVSVGPIELVTTVFRQATFQLSDPVGTGRGTDLGPDRFLTRSLGDAYGIELGARGALRRNIFFLTSYTLSRATRAREGKKLPSAYDRTHILHVALLYELGNSWRAGVRHVFYSGFPADEATFGRAPSEHPERVRPFYRLDIRVSKRWKLGARGYIGLALDMLNATLSQEVFDVTCDGDQCRPRTIGPITIPSLALEGGF